MFISFQRENYGYGGDEDEKRVRLKLIDLLECAQISEDDMQESALSFFTEYAYAQDRYQEYSERTENYVNSNGQNDNYYNKYYGENGVETSANLFIGPACGTDNMSIKLAVYSDSRCTQPVNGISVSELLGYNPLAENTDIFP